MSERIYPPLPEFTNSAVIKEDEYLSMLKLSRNDPDRFWRDQGKSLDWIKPYSKVKNTNYSYPNISIKWFEDGILNVCENCVDRHLAKKGDQVAIIWEGDEPTENKYITYNEVHRHVSKLANAYKSLGVKKGDRVIIYMPMIPEATYAMLASARIGAIHSVVFAGFSPEALRARILDCEASLVITADEAPRGGKITALKSNVDQAVADLTSLKTIVVKRTGAAVPMVEGRDYGYDELLQKCSPDCPPEPMNAEDPLFILYTSGSTGKPKGVQHSSAGYLLYASLTHKYIFDYKEDDVFWCTADVGWITGHSYIVYGPLSNGAKTIMFEGIPTYPDASRFWQICEKYGVSQFYTAPTAIRALMGLGDNFVEKSNLSCLRLLGSVGEPINPEAWEWYNRVVGKGCCPIVDTWWQTETGGILISPIPGITATKPGSATLPFLGIDPVIIDPATGKEFETTECEGVLAIRDSWPGQMRTVFGDHERFVDTYFKEYPGFYFTGDGCRRDKDGYYWITGRVDDVLNVSGHRMGAAEVESALVSHPSVAESAVVGSPHPIKGQAIYAFVTLMAGENPSEDLKNELRNWVGQEIGPIAKPDKIQWAPGLPKTRSGKIMRRILRKIAEDQVDELGDTSTLADPTVVESLIQNRVNG